MELPIPRDADIAAIVFFLSLLSLFIPSSAEAQEAHLRLVEESTGFAVEQLQARGYLLALNPTDTPYSDGEILEALSSVEIARLSSTERYWFDLLESDISSLTSSNGNAIMGIRARSGLRASNNGRLDQQRYLSDDSGIVWPYVLIQPRFSLGGFAAAIGVRHDVFYEEDPDGIDTALRLFLRAEDAYIRYETDWFSANIGRFQRHWGAFSSESTILSANPRSYDQFGFTLGGGRFRLRSLLGELDSITADGEFTGTAGADSTAAGNERRYIAAHRLDWRPNRDITITAFQSVLYSGPNANLSLKYINPLLPVLVSLDNTPKNDENNGFAGFSVWFRHQKMVIFLQATVDDVDILNRKEPSSFGLVGSLTFSDIVGSTTIKVGATAIGSRTFNTEQTEGQYIYLLRGLATQFSDYVSFFSEVNIFAFGLLKGLTITPRIDFLWQGEQDIRNPFPTSKEVDTILSGTVERTVRPALRFRYEPSRLFFVAGDIGVNTIQNADHVPGDSRTKILGLLEIGVRLSTEKLFKLGF